MFAVFLTSCVQEEPEYTGNYPELFSVAISSILGARGYADDESPWRAEPRISILEEDNFGRVLFMYSEDSFVRRREADDGSIRTMVTPRHIHIIVQKVDGDYVYFYPHYNLILGRMGRGGVFDIYFEDVPRISDEDFDAFKEANSWNQEMSDDSVFDRVRIVRRKEDGPLSSNQLAEARLEIFPDAEAGRRLLPNWIVFLRMDRYGRSIFVRSRDYEHVVVLFQPDHSLDTETSVLRITDMFNYQTELRLFLEANGWNTTWVEP